MTAHDILDHKVYPQAENKENMLSRPNLLAMHHERLLGKEHSAKRSSLTALKRNKVNKS